jgi:NAD(P)-dependent dehydrogenase (short-subunit alcohol dehydrogenase family)
MSVSFRVLVTGGAGFVGSNLALLLAERRSAEVVAFDNLHRRGSELALPRLRAGGVEFIHGDIRNHEDLDDLPATDLVIECSAEPSVHGGYDGGGRYLINTNLIGTVNCLDYARRYGSALISCRRAGSTRSPSCEGCRCGALEIAYLSHPASAAPDGPGAVLPKIFRRQGRVRFTVRANLPRKC